MFKKVQQKLINITSSFLLLLILRGALISPLYAHTNVERVSNQLAQTTEEDFWQQLFKALVSGNESEKEPKEEEKGDKEKKEGAESQRNPLKGKTSYWKSSHWQAILFEYQSHLCASHWHDWLYHSYLTFRAKQTLHLYIDYHNLKVEVLFIA